MGLFKHGENLEFLVGLNVVEKTLKQIHELKRKIKLHEQSKRQQLLQSIQNYNIQPTKLKIEKPILMDIPQKKIMPIPKDILDRIIEGANLFYKNKQGDPIIYVDFNYRRYRIEGTLGNSFFAKFISSTAPAHITYAEKKAAMVNASYHHIRQALETPKFLRELGLLKMKHRLLDVGTGNGYFVDELQKMGIDAIGIDPNLEERNFDKSYMKKLLLSDFMNTRPKLFDVVTFMNFYFSFHTKQTEIHRENKFLKAEDIIEETKRILRKDGTMILGIAYYNPEFITGKEWLYPHLKNHFKQVGLITIKNLEDNNQINKKLLSIGSIAAFFICKQPL
jgi:SAM-dependent methyltransferase